MPEKVRICEVGLRDGLQNEKQVLSAERKIELLKDLVDAGFPVIEVGSFMNPVKMPQMASTDEVFRAVNGLFPDVELRALIANLRGVERADGCGCRKVKLNVSASREHNLRNLGMTPEKSVEGFSACVDAANERGMKVSGSISMPFGSPWEGTIPLIDVDSIIEAYMNVGIHEISLSDASGMAVPVQVFEICTHVREQYPEASWWLHFHNTRGNAIANIFSAMQAGMTQFDASFAGLGGCPFIPGASGNVSSEDVINMCDESGISTGIDIDKVINVSKKLMRMMEIVPDSCVLRAGPAKNLIEED